MVHVRTASTSRNPIRRSCKFRAERWPEVATVVMIQKCFELIQGPKTVFKKSSITFAVCGVTPY